MTPHAETVVISWRIPPPRTALDRFVGPGATRPEILLQFVPPVIVALGAIAAAILGGWGWTPLQLAVLGVIVLDMVGGVMTKATNAAKRWWHRPGQGVRQHLTFVLMHLAQPTVVVLLFDPGNWGFVVGGYGYVWIASLVILTAPLYLRRPVASLLLVLGIFMSLYVLHVPQHFEWFPPVFYSKLLVGHLVRKEPCRPPSVHRA